MDFGTAINTCLKKYAQFQGRASRTEYWYFVLFAFLMSCAAATLDDAFGVGDKHPLNSLVSLGLFFPWIAAGARRLHDTNRSGLWELWLLLPVIGWIAFLILVAEKSDPNDNHFGPARPFESPKEAVP